MELTSKVEVYNEIVKLLGQVIVIGDKISNQKKHQLTKQITENGLRLSLFGSQKVIKKYVDWKLYCMNSEQDPHGLITKFVEVVIEMRKDLFGVQDKITVDDIMATFIVIKN